MKYKCYDNSLNERIFTEKEVDVISCIINDITKSKAIADIIDIAPRTVDVHIQNINQKTKFNSRKDIPRFFKNSYIYNKLAKHYIYLRTRKIFSNLIKFKKKINVKYYIERTFNNIITSDTEYYLKQTGAILTNEIQSADFVIFFINKQNYAKISKQKKEHNYIYILCEDNPHKSASSYDIDLSQADYYFERLLLLLVKISYNVFTKDDIKDFRKKQLQAEDINIDLQKIEYHFSQKQNIFIYIITALIITASGIIYFYSSNNYTVISNHMFIPDKKIMIERKELINAINHKLSIKGLQAIALTGIGGSGKTTLARRYALSQESKLIWEINCENEQVFLLSIQNLAYALCDDSKLQNQLEFIEEIKDDEIKTQQLCNLVIKLLKKNNNWFLVYDNVESFDDIAKFFPFSIKRWGSGKIIITTRNRNIKNYYINDVIDVGYLSKRESTD